MIMAVAEQINERVKVLPESVQAEVLNFVEFLSSKDHVAKKERTDWSDLSLSQAMRGMESETPLYSIDDVTEMLP
jgi:hypothetical protein